MADSTSSFFSDADTLWSSYNVISIQQLVKNIKVDGSDELREHNSDLTDDEVVNAKPRLMAILYTSGSTGVPKGVQITHRMAMNRISWQWDRFPFQSGDVGCLKTSLLFVDSISQIFATILQQVPLVVFGKKLMADIESFMHSLQEHNITHIVLVPSLLRAMLDVISVRLKLNGLQLPNLKHWVTSGEPLSFALAQQFFSVFPSGKALYNFYGSTEVMGDVTYEEFLSADDVIKKSLDGVMSIGEPITNTVVYLVDDNLQLVPVGETGEICVSGLNINDKGGYIVDASPATNFQRNPFVDRLDELVDSTSSVHCMMYRTGDYGRIINNRLIYQGRKDQQVCWS